MAPPFDTIRVWNPGNNPRSHVQEFALPCRDRENVQLSDRFYAVNSTRAGINFECGVERTALLRTDVGMNIYPSGNQRVLRLTMPVRLLPGYNDIQIFRGPTGVRLPLVVRPNVVTGLAQTTFTFRPYGTGSADMLVFDGFQTKQPVEIKNCEYSTVYKFRGRAAQPRQNGGNPFWYELILEVFGAGLDHCRWWFRWGIFDPRDPEWSWNQDASGGQSDPRVRLIIGGAPGAGERFPFARLITRGTWGCYEQGWNGSDWEIVLDRRDPSVGWGGYYLSGQSNVQMGTLWFSGGPGQGDTGDPFRDSTGSAEILDRATAAISTSWYAKSDAWWLGSVMQPPGSELASTFEGVRTVYHNSCEAPGAHNSIEPIHTVLNPRQDFPKRGPWQQGQQGYTSARYLGHFMMPQTQLGGPHREFGVNKYWMALSLGMPTMLETLRQAACSYGHPMFLREVDASPVRAATRPLVSTSRGMPTGEHAGFTDKMGKAGLPVLANQARDQDAQWEGWDEAHQEDVGYPLFAVLSQDRGIYETVDFMAEALEMQFRTTGSRALHTGAQTRGVGRRAISFASVYYAVKRTDLYDNLDHLVTAIDAHRADQDAQFPGRIIRPLHVENPCGQGNCALGYGGALPGDWRYGYHWRAWEESVSAAGIWCAWKETGNPALYTLAKDLIKMIVEYAFDCNFDPANGPIFQGTGSYRQSLRYVGTAFNLPGTRKLTEAEFATGAGLGGPMQEGVYCLQSGQGATFTSTLYMALDIARRDNDAMLLEYCNRVMDSTMFRRPPRNEYEDSIFANGDFAGTAGGRYRPLPSSQMLVNSPPVLWPPVHGVNLAKLHGYESDQPWTNRMRLATHWAVCQDGTGNVINDRLPAGLAPDATGYATTVLTAGTHLRCNLAGPGNMLLGTWRCAWDGTGNVTFDYGNGNQTSAVSPIDVNVVQTASQFRVHINSQNAAPNNVRNVRVYFLPYAAYLAGTAQHPEGGPAGNRGFDPDYRARWFGAKLNAARFLEWTMPDSPDIIDSTDFRGDTYYTESDLIYNGNATLDIHGASQQAYVDFINEFNLDYANFPVPYRTWEDGAPAGPPADTWARSLYTRLLADGPAKTRYLFAIGNEIWNGRSANMHAAFATWGRNGGPCGEAARVHLGGSDHDFRMRAQALRSSILFASIRDVDPDRAICVIDTQMASSTQYFRDLLTRLNTDAQGNPLNPPQKIAYDAFSVTAYMSQNLHSDRTDAQVAAMTPADFAAYVQTDINQRLFGSSDSCVTSWAQMAHADSALLIPYEFGKHEAPSDTIWSPAARDAIYAYYRSPEHRTVCDSLLTHLRSVANIPGHGFQYHLGGAIPEFAWGLWEDYTDDGGTRPGIEGMQDEQFYLAYAQAGANLFDNTPPSISNPGAQVAAENTPFSLQILASDPDPGDVLTYTMNGHPAGLSINSGTGLINGSPNLGTANPTPYATTVRATDRSAAYAEVTFNIHVQPQGGGGANTPPVLVPPGPQTCQEGVAFNLQLIATDPEVPPQTLTYIVSNLPQGLSVNVNSGLITGTPAAGTSATPTRAITATVRDSENATSTSIFQLTILPPVQVNTRPTLQTPVPIVQEATEGVAFNLQLVGADAEAPPQILTYAWTGNPAGLVLNTATGLITGTPAQGTSGGSSGGLPPGNYAITAVVRDNGDPPLFSDPLTQFAIHVNPPAPGNRPPVMQQQLPIWARENVPFDLQLIAVDPEGDQLTWDAIGLPAGLTIGQNTGRITGTPAVGTSAGSPYTVTPAVTDNINPPVGMPLGNFALFVEAEVTNHPPDLTNPGPQSAIEGRGFHLHLQATDPDGDQLTWRAISGLPPGIELTGNGNLTGVPSQGTARPFPYVVTIRVTDPLGLFDEETFDIFVAPGGGGGGGGGPHERNADLYLIGQMVPGFRTSAPSAITDVLWSGCIGYEVGEAPIDAAARMDAIIADWYAFPYLTRGDKHEPHPQEIAVTFGGRWSLVVELNTRGGGVMWRWRLTDSNPVPLLPAGFNLLTQADGTGRAAGGDISFYLPGDDTQAAQVRASEDGARIGLSRVETGFDWRGPTAPMSSRTPRWTHGTPLISVGVQRPAGNRVDIETRSIPLDWSVPAARGTVVSPLSPVLFNFEQRRRTRFNWPREGIHTTFRNARLLEATPQTNAWGINLEVLGAFLHEGFDERYLFDGANGAKTWTDLSGDPLHAQFISPMFAGVAEHAHFYADGRSYLLAVLDTATWPALYREVGTRLTVNVAAVGRTANAVAVGLPAIPDTPGLVGRVLAIGAGNVTLQIDVTGLVDLAPPWTSNGASIPTVTYVDGTFTFPALGIHYLTGAGDSFLLRGRETVGIEPDLPPGQRGARVRRAMVTDLQGRCGLVLRCNGANVRGVPGYSLTSDFAIGIAGTLVGDDLQTALRVNQAFTYLGAQRVTPAAFQQPGTERASAYQKLTHGIQQVIEQAGAGSSRFFTGQVAPGVVDADMFTQLPCYLAMGTTAQVQGHIEWLFDQGWLAFPLTNDKYHSVP